MNLSLVLLTSVGMACKRSPRIASVVERGGCMDMFSLVYRAHRVQSDYYLTRAGHACRRNRLLGLAKDHDARILVASTSEVYGDPLVHPQNEGYYGNVSPIGPRGVYDEAKRFMESITMAYHRFHGLDTRIVRIFNTYGSRMRLNDGRVVPAFMGQALRGEDLTVLVMVPKHAPLPILMTKLKGFLDC